MLRDLLARLTGDHVLRRHLPKEFGGGRMYVTATGGGLRYLRHDMRKLDPVLAGLVREFVHPGSVVWDIGANMGLFTFMAAHRAGPKGFVLAVEPDVDNATLLFQTRRAMDPAHNARVEVLSAAVSDGAARIAALQIATCRACNSLRENGPFMGAAVDTRQVALLSADELLASFPPPNFIKVDVEGFEINVLKGASRLLQETRPLLALEVQPQEPIQRPIHDLLKSYRYRCYASHLPKDQRQEMDLPAFHCLAIPD